MILIQQIINNIPAEYRPVVITAAATLTGAFIGAIIAQYFSHRMTMRRDNQKYFKEMYQNLYAPILFDVYSYVDIYTHFRRGHDINPEVDEDEIYKKILKHIENNLLYATPRLISHFHSVKQYDYQDDMSGFYYRLQEIELLEVFLNELRLISHKSNSLDNKNMEKVIENMIYLRVWVILTEYFNDAKAAAGALSYKFYYSHKNINYKNYKRLKKYFTTNTLINTLYSKIYALNNSKGKLFNKLTSYLLNTFFKEYNFRYRINNIKYLYKVLISNKEDKEMLLMNTKEGVYSNGVNNDINLKTIINNLSFLNTSHEIENGIIRFNIHIHNWDEKTHVLSVNNFAFIRQNETRLENDESESYFRSNENKSKEYKLFTSETIELILQFDRVDPEYRTDYILYFEKDNKCYPIHKLFE